MGLHRSAHKPVLLLVSDDASMSQQLSDLLQDRIEPTEIVCHVAADALRHTAEQRVDVLLLECRPFDGDAMLFLERFRATRPDVPAVVVTSESVGDFMADAVNRRLLQGLFVHPVRTSDFVDVVGELLGRRMGTQGRIPPGPPAPHRVAR